MPFDNPQPFTPQSSPEIELLRVARAIIEYKWSKNWHACAVTAIGIAANNPYRGRMPTKIEKRVARLLMRELPMRHRCCWFFLNARGRIIMYNDWRWTTRTMVLGLFDRAIQRLERKQMALCYSRAGSATIM